MSYLAITKFDQHQHYKNRNPPWIKFYTKMLDPKHPLNELPVSTRYLFDRLLLLAAKYDNAIPNDSELIAKLLRMPPRDCREGIHRLLEGRWIKVRKTSRRASKGASKVAPLLRTDFDTRGQRAEKEKELSKGSTSEVDAEHAITKLLQAVNTKDDREVSLLRGHAVRLPEGAVVKVAESVTGNGVRNRFAYALGALKDEARMRS